MGKNDEPVSIIKVDTKLDFTFKDFIKNRPAKVIIKYLPALSFLIAGILILLIFNYFFDFSQLVYVIIGFLLAYLLIKTNLFFKFDRINWRFKFNYQTFKNIRFKLPSIFTLYNASLVILRALFFNILNDLFIQTIFWTAFLGGLYSLNILQVRDNFNFSALVGTLSLLGILSGFFQFFIQRYKEEIFSKLVTSVSHLITKEIQTVSFYNFMKFLEDEGTTEDKKNQGKIKEILSPDRMINYAMHGFRPTSLFLSTNISGELAAFDLLENYKYITGKDTKINKDELKNAYERYFNKKVNEFKNEIMENHVEMNEMKKLLFSNIIFFEEAFANLMKTDLEQLAVSKTPMSFKDFYNKFIYDCLILMIDSLTRLSN